MFIGFCTTGKFCKAKQSSSLKKLEIDTGFYRKTQYSRRQGNHRLHISAYLFSTIYSISHALLINLEQVLSNFQLIKARHLHHLHVHAAAA